MSAQLYINISRKGVTANATPEIASTNDPTSDSSITSEKIQNLQQQIENSKRERESLIARIKLAEENMAALQADLYKKQNGLFSKFFAKQETIDGLLEELNQDNKNIEELKQQFEQSPVNLNIQFDVEAEDAYKKLSTAFSKLAASAKIWDITTEVTNTSSRSLVKSTVERKEVTFKTDYIEYINTAYPAFHLQNSNGSQIFIYPTFIFLLNRATGNKLVGLNEINFSFKPQNFLESDPIPRDSKIIAQTWAKVNGDGSPDMRYKDNYQIPVVKYASFTLSSQTGLNETYNISNFEAAENFASEFLNYISFFKGHTNSGITNITREYFDSVKEFGDKFVGFINKMKSDKQFTRTIYQFPAIQELPFESSDELIQYFFVLDIMKCFNMTADITNLKSKESFALKYVIGKSNGLNLDSYTNVAFLDDQKVLTTYGNMYNSLKEEIEKPVDDNSFFRFPILLSAYNQDSQTEYLTNLYRFASIVVKADGSVTLAEEDALKKIMSLTELRKSSKTKEEQKQPESGKPPRPKLTLEESLAELNSLTGLDAVKEEIHALINFIKVQKAREQSGLKSSSISYHIVFTGNPGTGKTTVARIVSQIYKNLGVLTEGQLVETDRSGLVAEYVGQTAVKVNKVVDSAINGVLFVDEAYSLVGHNQDDFGKEAIASLIKRMEDDRIS